MITSSRFLIGSFNSTTPQRIDHMKMTKREFVEQLDKYPDDFEMDLGYYFLVDASNDDEPPRIWNSVYEIPILGTAADEENKVIKFVLDKSNEGAIERISKGYDPLDEAPSDETSDDS